MKKFPMFSLVVGATLLQGCAVQSSNEAVPVVEKNIGMANPADGYCTQIGGTLNVKQNTQGQYTTCTLPDGQEIDSWALFRRDHPVKK